MAGVENYDISTFRLTGERSSSELHPHLICGLDEIQTHYVNYSLFIISTTSLVILDSNQATF